MKRPRLPAVLTAGLVLAVFFAFSAWPRGWRYVGVLEIGHPYADLVAILSAGEAHAAGHDVHVENPFDPFGRTHVYGPLWLHTAALGLEVRDASWLGPLLVVAFVAAAAALLAPATPAAAAGGVLLLLSPPVLLGLERGNNDLIIFLLLGAAALLAGRGARGAAAASGIVAGAGLLKFFPLAAAGTFLGLRGGRTGRVALVLGAAAVFGLGWMLQAREYREALEIAPRPLSVFAYGVGLLPITWARLGDTREWLILGFLPIFVAGGWLAWRARKIWWDLLPATGGRAVFAVMAGLAWLCCYALTLSFPYRAVFLLPWFFWWWQAAPSVRAPRWLAAGVIAVLWLGVPKFLVMANTDELPWSVGAISFLSGLEQAALLVMTSTIALSLLGWLLRGWRRGPPGG
jgi:hypothetical protein